MPDNGRKSIADFFRQLDLRTILDDKSALALIVSNILAAIVALYQGWTLGAIIFVYWSQNIVIGVINIVRIMGLKEFSTDGVLLNGKPVMPTAQTKRQMAIFFTLHYGIFHAVYLGFLLSNRAAVSSMDYKYLFITTAMFAAAHWYSYNYNREKDSGTVPNIGRILLFPYARILPMHIIILAGGVLFAHTSSAIYIILFSALKTVADVVMHAFEHS